MPANRVAKSVEFASTGVAGLLVRGLQVVVEAQGQVLLGWEVVVWSLPATPAARAIARINVAAHQCS